MQNLDIDVTEIAALVGLAGAAAAYVSQDGGESQQPVFNIGEGFGQREESDDSTDEWDGDSSVTEPADETNPEATDGDSTLPDGEWTHEEDNPDWSDEDFDFGGDTEDITEPDVGEYLRDGFNYEDRTDLIDDENQVGL
jgi:hypothetical protein